MSETEPLTGKASVEAFMGYERRPSIEPAPEEPKVYATHRARSRKPIQKIAKIRGALVSAGFDTAEKQAIVLGVTHSTAWALLNRDKRVGPSAKIIKRILSSPHLRAAARRRVEEYIEEKIDGAYGHSEARRRWFRDQFHIWTDANENQL